MIVDTRGISGTSRETEIEAERETDAEIEAEIVLFFF